MVEVSFPSFPVFLQLSISPFLCHRILLLNLWLSQPPTPGQNQTLNIKKKTKSDTFRYSLFIILYPVGISSEWWMMYQATTVATNLAVTALFYFFLGLYVPGK